MSSTSIERQAAQESTPIQNLPETSLRQARTDRRIIFTLCMGTLLFRFLPQNLALIKVLFGDEIQDHCFQRQQLWVWIVGVWSVLALCCLVRSLVRRWRGGGGSHEPSGLEVAVPPSGNMVPARRVGVCSYVTRHWRGELSLGVSWWVNRCLVYLGFEGVGALLQHQHTLSSMPRARLLFAVALLVAQVLVPPWQWVGLWRSAQNHIRRTQKVFWATIVQILVVSGGITWALVTPFLLAIGANTAFLQYTYGSDHIRLVNGDSELEIRGPMGYGLAETVQKTLDQVPEIKRLRLNSPGGLMDEGRKLHDLIRARHLDTYSERGCYSACTLAFVAGKERTIHAQAKLGFHRPCLVGWDTQRFHAEIELVRRYYIAAGVAEEFVARALNTPPHQMWFPSLEELLAARVITHTPRHD